MRNVAFPFTLSVLTLRIQGMFSLGITMNCLHQRSLGISGARPSPTMYGALRVLPSVGSLGLYAPSAGFPALRRTRRSMMMMAKPKSGNVVDNYQTASVNCAKCRQRLFRYKKKNGTKSNLVKCYVERICEDSAGILKAREDIEGEPSRCNENEWLCPSCDTKFARTSLIHGRPALKIVGGKVRMTKK